MRVPTWPLRCVVDNYVRPAPLGLAGRREQPAVAPLAAITPPESGIGLTHHHPRLSFQLIKTHQVECEQPVSSVWPLTSTPYNPQSRPITRRTSNQTNSGGAVIFSRTLESERSRSASPRVTPSTLPDAGSACNTLPEERRTPVPPLLLGCVMAPE